MNLHDHEVIPLENFVEQAYLNYAMYVILDRALPHLADGLKPVQRRIVYAMSELGLSHHAKFKKSARTVGDVLGKYHPHGDAACYEAMVLMAQHFSYRYPFIEGQGNWGSSDDPKSFAAMRYTEARLSPYAYLLLKELEQGTVEWVPNFDGSMREPKTLPARVPNLLINGASGIAVGMSTDIPPHHLGEVIQACAALLSKPNMSWDELLSILPGPDFPTAAEIVTSATEIAEIYKTGQGSIKQRATYHLEEQEIIIDALPYQASGSKILEQIAQQMHAKKLPMLNDLRDESDHENPTRLVLTMRSERVDAEQVMQHLFATTDLEKSYRVNLNMIGLNGKPQIKNLKQILEEWLAFRLDTVAKRLKYRLDKILQRLHLLEGLLTIYLHLDEVIKIIREEEHPKKALMRRFTLSEAQAEAILEIRLRQLARLQEIELQREQKELSRERDQIEHTLANERLLKKLVREELLADAAQFPTPRQSPMVAREQAQAFKEEHLVPSEPITLVLSQMGWVRAAKGHDIDPKQFTYRAGDGFLCATQGKNTQTAVFFDHYGRGYSIPAHQLPSARGYGEPLTSRFNPPDGARFVQAFLINKEKQNVLVASNYGYGFITTTDELLAKNKNGKIILQLSEGAQAMPPVLIDEKQSLIVAVSNLGRCLIFPLSELPQLSKGKGNKIMQLSTEHAKNAAQEILAHLLVVQPDASLVFHTSDRSLSLKPNDLKKYHGKRGQRGQKLPRGLQQILFITSAL